MSAHAGFREVYSSAYKKAATLEGATAFLMPDDRRPLSHHQPPVAELLPRVLANVLRLRSYT